MKICIVVQRYGAEVNGGAETLAKLVAEHLSRHIEVEAATTTARDASTWKPFYPEGVEVINGVKVRRFNVSRPRDILRFDLISKFIFHFPHPGFFEKIWMTEQGPYSPSLISFIEQSYEDFDFFLFVTYLYAGTYMGIPKAGKKAVLLPTAHDEPPIYLKIYQEMFNKTSAFIYLTPEEKDLMERLFEVSHKPNIIAGSGVSDDFSHLEETPSALKPHKDYFIYTGRVCRSKLADVLIDYFSRYLKETGRDISLVIAGRRDPDIKEPSNPNIIMTGFISEKDKFLLERDALALINPSRYESLSIVLLEAWLMETPVIVNGECLVMKNQVKRAEGGLTYHSYEEFAKSLNFIIENKEKSRQMAQKGRKYVQENYSWNVVESKMIKFFESLKQNMQKEDQ